MTQHLVSFAVGIDDEAIIRNVEENAHKQIIQDIKMEVLNRVFVTPYYNQKAISKTWDGKVQLERNAILSEAAEKIVKEAFVEYKDEIIEKAAKVLADSYRRTKAWKERAEDVVS